MFKIANKPHASANTINTAISPCLTIIIDRIFEIDADKHYATGQELAIELICRARQASYYELE
jgi:hypothetical protein